MLKIRIKQRAKHGAYAAKRLAKIEASIVALGNEDLLDLADILKSHGRSPLAEIASTEMTKRQLSL
jgi:hypothetical protein